MKKLFLIVCLALLGSVVYAQDVIRKGNTFEQVSKKKRNLMNQLRQSTHLKPLDGKVYPVYISIKGKCFIKRISKKGEEYPYYNLPKELKDLISKEYGISQLKQK